MGEWRGPVAELREMTVHVDTGRWSGTVLESVSFAVPEGQVTALLGESGCGKSMAAAALTGLLPATAKSTGEVLVAGVPVADQRQWRRLRASTIGFLPQAGIAAFDADVAVGAQLRRLHDLRGACSVEQACAAASYPADVQHLLPGQHSSEQVQRAALAAALLSAPRLLVVDEPTASLDTATAYAVWGSLRRYADTGAAVLAITHDIPHLIELGVVDRMLFMRDGRIRAAGSADAMRALADPCVRGFFPALSDPEVMLHRPQK